MRKIKYKGRIYLINSSSRKDKQYVVVTSSGDKIHFADPTMPEYPGTKRGDNYCARSFGIGNIKNPKSANFWSRSLWSCKGKKSISRRKFATIGK